MPTVFANSNDGFITSTNANFATARNASTGTAVDNTGNFGLVGLTHDGGYQLKRVFFKFDTRGVTIAPSSANIVLYFNSPVSGDYILVKADDFGAALETSEFGGITNRPGTGTYNGVVTDFSNNFTPGVAQYVTVSLNSNALTQIGVSGQSLNVCLLNYTFDYLNGSPDTSTTAQAQVITNDFPGTDFDIKLDYVEGSAGRSVAGGGTFSREELRSKQSITTNLAANTDFEFKFENNLKQMVYYTLEGVNGKDIFNTASIRTTSSDSGSNVLNFISGSSHAAFILAGNSTSSFFMSGGVDISGNNIQATATNLSILGPESSSVAGVKMDILS